MISGYGKRGGGYGRGISEQGLFYHFKFRAQQLFISSYTSPSVIFKKPKVHSYVLMNFERKF